MKSGDYTICWCGVESNLVYAAWYKKQAIGYFRKGNNAEKKKAAFLCCKEHFFLNDKKAG